jgi:hypothetical protein
MLYSAVVVVVGSAIFLALTMHLSSIGLADGIQLAQVGVIMMIAGGVGLLVSTIIFRASLASSSRLVRTSDDQAVGLQGSSNIVHGEQHAVANNA